MAPRGAQPKLRLLKRYAPDEGIPSRRGHTDREHHDGHQVPRQVMGGIVQRTHDLGRGRAERRRRQGGEQGRPRHQQRRRALQRALYEAASKEIDEVSRREVWLMGTVLYWAEGAKEKEYRPGAR